MSVEERVRRSFERQAFMETLGAQLVEVFEGRCVIRVPYQRALTQQHGLFHGGVTAALADNAAGFACYTTMADDEQPLTVEFKINYLNAAGGEGLVVRSRVLRAGRRIKHAQSDVYAVTGEHEELVATALATIAATRSVSEVPPAPSDFA